MKSTHSLFRGISLFYLDGNLSYLIFDRFVCWQVSPFYFLPDGFSNYGPVQMLKNHHLHHIHSWMKDIRVVAMQYISLK